MTMSASRVGYTDQVEVTMNYGPIHAHCTEHAGHIRHFWAMLGQVLDKIEHADDTPP